MPPDADHATTLAPTLAPLPLLLDQPAAIAFTGLSRSCWYRLRGAGKRIGLDTLGIDLLRRHFRGASPEHVKGVHSTASDNASRWVAIGIDHHDQNAPTPEANRRAALARLLIALAERERGARPQGAKEEK
jgi:hypothetical protein